MGPLCPGGEEPVRVTSAPVDTTFAGIADAELARGATLVGSAVPDLRAGGADRAEFSEMLDSAEFCRLADAGSAVGEATPCFLAAALFAAGLEPGGGDAIPDRGEDPAG